MALGTCVCVAWCLPAPGSEPSGTVAGAAADKPPKHSLVGTLRKYAGVFVTAGGSVLLLQFIRASRNLLIPLSAHDLHLNPLQIGFCVSVGYFLDTILFVPTGYAMDRVGRKRVGLPAFFVLSAGLLLLPFVHTRAQLHIAAVVMGLGNGLSSGFNMVWLFRFCVMVTGLG
jgi:MFS family permease